MFYVCVAFVQNVLYTLGQLATEFPEVSELLALRLQEADLRMPARPPPKTMTVQNGQQQANARRAGGNNNTRRGQGSAGEIGNGLEGTSMDSATGSQNMPRPVNLGF